MRIKHTFRLPPGLSTQIADYAARKRISQATVVEAALTSFFSPDGSARLEAAISRRLDHQTRELDRLAEHIELSNEVVALFVRFWLTTTPPLPDTALAAARASGRDRYRGFIGALGRRMEKGQSLAREIADEIDADAAESGKAVG
jgi:hypothetical protein